MGFNESRHPRVPPGSSEGGQFSAGGSEMSLASIKMSLESAGVEKKLEGVAKNYSQEDQDLMEDYAAGSHADVNAHLRGKKNKAGAIIAAAMRRNEINLPPGTIVYRGISTGKPADRPEEYPDRQAYEFDRDSFNRVRRFTDKFREGQTIRVGGLQSSSLDPKVGARFSKSGYSQKELGEGAREVIFEIRARRGTYLGSRVKAGMGKEREIVLPHNSRYSVTRVKDVSLDGRKIKIISLRQK